MDYAEKVSRRVFRIVRKNGYYHFKKAFDNLILNSSIKRWIKFILANKDRTELVVIMNDDSVFSLSNDNMDNI